MPKEVIRSKDGHVGVHWWNFPRVNDKDYVMPLVSVSVGVGKNFRFEEAVDEVYEDLFFNFDNPDDVEDFIKKLRRAKRKVFGSGRS